MLIRLIERLGSAAGWLFVIAMIISVYEVIMRYAFNAPSTWVHEISTTLCALAFCLGGAYAMARGEHIRITVLWDKAGRESRRLIEIASCLVGAFYLGGLGWGAWLQARESVWRFEAGRLAPELTPGPPNLPLPAIVKGGLLVGALLFLAVVIIVLWRHLRRQET